MVTKASSDLFKIVSSHLLKSATRRRGVRPERLERKGGLLLGGHIDLLGLLEELLMLG